MDELLERLREENHKLSRELEYYRNYDPLTGLFNKDAFYEQVEQNLLNHPNIEFQLISFDVEHFKLVNDYFGTVQGDLLLQEIAKQLQQQFVEPFSCFSRFVADVFVILIQKEFGGEAAGKKILDIFQNYPIDMDIKPAIGFYDIKQSISISTMCDRACMAANSVKGNFIHHMAFYNDSMRNILIEEQELLNGVEAALENHEFEIYMQPKCNMNTGKITGAEILVRWIHPQKGLIPPKDFIPIFEKNGFIKKLDQYVWRESARWIKAWTSKGNPPLPVSVNISRIDIIGMDVIGYLNELIKEFELDPSWLELEITESAYSARGDEIIIVIDRLMKNGFTISMDDFGSGYSSLNMLKDISVDILKLDMRFLDKSDRKSKDILESVVHMAKWLNLKVIAEGVENRQQVDFLLGIGCTYAQGYYYYKPMPLKQFEELLKQEDKVDYADCEMKDLEQNTLIRFKDLLHEDIMSEMLLDNILGTVVLYSYEQKELHAISANEKYIQLFGEDIDEKRDAIQKVVPEDRDLLYQAIDAARLNGTQGEKVRFRRLLKGGTIIWVQLRLFFLSDKNNEEIYYGSIENITDEMETMEELRTTQELFRLAMESSQDTIFELDVRTKIAKYSEQSRIAFGLKHCLAHAPEDFIEQGSVCKEYEQTFCDLYEAIYRGEDRASCIIRAHMGNHQYVWNRITLISIKDNSGQTIKAVGLVENITKEKELEEQLEEIRIEM